MNFKNVPKNWLITGMVISGIGLVVAVAWQYSKFWQIFLCDYHTHNSLACNFNFQKEVYGTPRGVALSLLQLASVGVLALCINAYSNIKKK